MGGLPTHPFVSAMCMCVHFADCKELFPDSDLSSRKELCLIKGVKFVNANII